jgi:hypothetical protein
MRVRHLRRHEQVEVLIEVDSRITKPDFGQSSVNRELLLQENRVDGRINVLLDVLHEYRLTVFD